MQTNNLIYLSAAPFIEVEVIPTGRDKITFCRLGSVGNVVEVFWPQTETEPGKCYCLLLYFCLVSAVELIEKQG